MGVSVPYTFSPNTTIQSAQSNANFAALVNAFNNGFGGSFASNGWMELPGQVIVQWGKVSNVAADGSAQASVVYPMTFPNNFWSLVTGISNPFPTNAWDLSLQTSTEATSGFSLSIAGGISTGTANAWWLAIGN